MSYYISKKLSADFNETVKHVTNQLKEEGFGVLTEIDVSATLKNKLDVQFKPYKILGACNPPFAFEALKSEDKIGTMLPCNVLVIQQEDCVEVAAVDPIASMTSVKNDALGSIALQVQQKLRNVIERL